MAENMQKFVVGIIIVGITLVIGIYIAGNFDTVLDTDNTAGSAINETFTTVTEVGETVSASSNRNFASLAVTECLNATGFETITAGNYTVGTTTIATTAASTYNNTNWLCSYTYTYSLGTSASNASGDLVVSLSNGTSWVTILVVVGFAVIVLGMLSSGLGKAASGRFDVGLGKEMRYDY